MTGADAAPYAVTARVINREDEQIVYATINLWLGTNTAHLTPLGVVVSVDGGRQWLQLGRAQLSAASANAPHEIEATESLVLGDLA